ncbi:hypothetical protein CONPUDRAFT_157157 [Coniophora puteana RWD-64-598 SS2]|uniref:Uncharacterized protein n=1 Tax=Coniophora puteana (strain RWD-64-598) TaxID=741705 RepID=A0A5M3MG17_CONPW|nr:uncharacterized protein CONPUDRAFT_157157 [Coniophora puteana RWD-64-598 SS2]EIW77987.1 hypothetical protein CONPUDRAFT_157157 [Coniophora puteana RWD-64-598 SS2]
MTLSVMQLVCDHPLSTNYENDTHDATTTPEPELSPSLSPSASLYHTILARYFHASHQSSGTPGPSHQSASINTGQALDMALYICQIPPADRGAPEHAFLERVAAVVSLDLYKRPGGHAPAACGALYTGSEEEVEIKVEVDVKVYRNRSRVRTASVSALCKGKELTNGDSDIDGDDGTPKEHWDVTVHWPKPPRERVCLCKRDQACTCDQLQWTPSQSINFRNDRCCLSNSNPNPNPTSLPSPTSETENAPWESESDLITSTTFTATLHDPLARTYFLHYGHTEPMRTLLDDAERKAINVASLPSQRAGDGWACLYHRALERFLAACCCNLACSPASEHILTSGGLVSRREDFDRVWRGTVEGRRRAQPEIAELKRFSYSPVGGNSATAPAGPGPSKTPVKKK